MDENGTALTIAETRGLIDSQASAMMLEEASKMATQLAKVIKDHNLASDIKGKQYVKCEGWTTLGALMGIFPVVEWTRPLEDGWEARVVVKRPDGYAIGAAEAQCTRAENQWRNRDDYALRSMAQTRATSKAMRLPLAWIMALAGYDVTPAEEVPEGGFDDTRPAQPADRRATNGQPEGRWSAAVVAKFPGDCYECGYKYGAGERTRYRKRPDGKYDRKHDVCTAPPKRPNPTLEDEPLPVEEMP